jgi:hypothetical protein
MCCYERCLTNPYFSSIFNVFEFTTRPVDRYRYYFLLHRKLMHLEKRPFKELILRLASNEQSGKLSLGFWKQAPIGLFVSHRMSPGYVRRESGGISSPDKNQH